MTVSIGAQRVALITGVTGQDGSYLAEQLIDRGYRVVGTTRSIGTVPPPLPGTLSATVDLIEWDLIDKTRFADILDRHRPDKIFNFAAFSSGEQMDTNPEGVTDINGVAVLRILEAIRQSGAAIRFCQASSSEVFAGTTVSPQSEATPRVPRSIYGAAKILADSFVKLYREKYGLFCCSAFLFNHESPRRGEGFVTTKVVRAAVQIKAGRQDRLWLGNLTAARDWGFAGDYVRAMALMLDAPEPRDCVIATGEAHSVAELCRVAFGAVSLDYRDYVQIDPRFYRPNEPTPIIGDASLARLTLGWTPTISFDQLIRTMVDAELARA